MQHDEQRQLDSAEADLLREFLHPSRDRVDVRQQTVAGFAEAPMRTYVPVLASRQQLRRTGAA